MFQTSTVDQQPEKGRKTIKSDQSKSTKDPPMIKSVFLSITQVW